MVLTGEFAAGPVLLFASFGSMLGAAVVLVASSRTRPEQPSFRDISARRISAVCHCPCAALTAPPVPTLFSSGTVWTGAITPTRCWRPTVWCAHSVSKPAARPHLIRL